MELKYRCRVKSATGETAISDVTAALFARCRFPKRMGRNGICGNEAREPAILDTWR